MPASSPARARSRIYAMRSLACSSSPWHRPPRPRLGGLIPGTHHLVAAGLRRPLTETLDLAAGVHDPLGAREERMAHRADLGLELFARRPGRERVPAHAGDDRVFVVGGMNLCFQRDASRRLSLVGEGAEQAACLQAEHSEVYDEGQPGSSHGPPGAYWNRGVVGVIRGPESLD